MAFKFHAFAPGALALARRIHLNTLIAPNFEQMFSGNFLLLIDALQLKRIKPNAAAASFAGVHNQATDLHLF